MALSELIRKLTVVDDIRRVKEVANLLIDGKHAAHGTVTLDINPATTTTVTDVRVSINSRISLQAITQDAAADIASIWVSDVTNGSFVINHPADASSFGGELVEDGDMALGNFVNWIKLFTATNVNLVMTGGVCVCGSEADGFSTGVGQLETLAASTTYYYTFDVANYQKGTGSLGAHGTYEFGNAGDGGTGTQTVNANGTYTGTWTTTSGGAGGLLGITGPSGINGTMDLDNVSVKSLSGAETRSFHYIIAG